MQEGNYKQPSTVVWVRVGSGRASWRKCIVYRDMELGRQRL